MADGAGFRDALTRIASDVDYRNALTKNPRALMLDYKLNLGEMRAMRQAAVLSGADVGEVDKLLMAKHQYMDASPMLMDNGCCCCCCCCGDTGVDVVYEYADAAA